MRVKNILSKHGKNNNLSCTNKYPIQINTFIATQKTKKNN